MITDFDDEIDLSDESPSGDGQELYEHFRFVADKGQQLLRVDKFLVQRLEKSSRNRIQQYRRQVSPHHQGRISAPRYRASVQASGKDSAQQTPLPLLRVFS